MPFLQRILFFFLTISTGTVTAQNGFTKPELYQITHVPPNAASLGKYGFFPVGLYTGIPNIQVPVYEIKSGRISVPVELSYHAGGIRVEELASLVGLGWSLNAGGVITRSVRGMPDEQPYLDGYTFFDDPVPASTKAPTTDPENHQEWVSEMRTFIMARKDGQPDLYSFNTGGLSGKFMYDQVTDKFIGFPANNLKIEYSQEAFILTDANGLRYIFSIAETSTREAVGSEVFTTATNWLLTQIYDPVTEKTVSFTYEPYNVTYPMMSGQFHYFAYGFTSDEWMSPKQNPNFSLLRLKEISFDNGKIVFSHELNRCDIVGDKALTNIRVFNNANTLIKDLDLHYDYFYSNFIDAQTPCNPEQSVNRRLKLIRVENKPVKASNSPSQVHSFEYRDGLPSRMSYSQDHWGYFNGKNNDYLYPKRRVTLMGQNVVLPGANRDVDPHYSGVGMLNRINFPTGGYTIFEFENNLVGAAEGTPGIGQDAMINASADAVPVEVQFTVNSGPCMVDGWPQENGVHVTYELFGVNLDLLGGFPGEALKVYIVNRNNTQQVYELTLISGPKTYMDSPIDFFLPNGDYTLIVDANPSVPVGGVSEAHVKLSWIHCELPPSGIGGINLPSGGQRVKSIKSYDSEGKVAFVKNYKYGQENFPLLSSGQCQFIPSYSFDVYKTRKHINGVPTSTRYLKRSAYSNYPMVSDNGRAVGYSNVIEMDGESGENGYTQYKYTNYISTEGAFLDIPGSLEIGGSPPFHNSYLRGLEREKTVFKKLGQQFIEVEKKITEYEFSMFNQNAKTVSGLSTYFTFMGDQCEFGDFDPISVGMDAVAYSFTFSSDIPYIKRTIEKSHSNGQTLEKITNLTNNDKNLLPYLTETVNSKGEKEFLTTRYPVDYTVTNAQGQKGQSISNLQYLNMVSVPVEQFTEIEKGGVKKLKNAIYTSYMPSKPLTDTLFYLTDKDLSISDYAGIGITEDGFSRESIYQPEIIACKYGISNELLQQQKYNHHPLSYIYNLHKTHHVAIATNASHDQIAYSSFEEDDNGSFNLHNDAKSSADAITGKMSYILNVGKNITKTELPQLPAGSQYVITYWAKNGSVSVNATTGTPIITKFGWTLNEHRLPYNTNSITISGSNVNIDELRLLPSSSQMSTTTFESLIGITSQCDINNNITYYEYDEFVRLLRIRDIDRNIVKQFEYRFQIPTHNNPIWVRTGVTRCKPCLQNAQYNSNILQKQERDDNPGSPTYNQMRWIDDGVSSSCVIEAAWEPTGLLTCDQQNGANTGLQLKQMKDMNPCSPTYNQLTYQSNGQNPTACPIPTFYASLSLTDPGSWFSDVVVNFYLNPSRTIPYNMQTMELTIRVTVYNDLTEETIVSDIVVNYSGGTQNVVMPAALLYEPGDKGNTWYSYELLPGPGFQVI